MIAGCSTAHTPNIVVPTTLGQAYAARHQSGSALGAGAGLSPAPACYVVVFDGSNFIAQRSLRQPRSLPSSPKPYGPRVTLVQPVTDVWSTVPVGNYAWNLGDSSTPSGNPVSHAYSSTGSKSVSLTVTDVVGVNGPVQSGTLNVSISPRPCPAACSSSTRRTIVQAASVGDAEPSFRSRPGLPTSRQSAQTGRTSTSRPCRQPGRVFARREHGRPHRLELRD